MQSYKRVASFVAALLLVVCAARADEHTTGLPALVSRPDAPYTFYLNFAGFNFSGTWGDSGLSPGSTPSINSVSADGAFSAADQAKIKEIWARVVQAYVPFNINVTTIDPAVGAGQASTDAQRQAYYETQPRLMHTVIGPQQNSWYGPYGGVSYLGTAIEAEDPSAYNGGAGAGWHTNWVFTEGLSNYTPYIADAAAHEIAHGVWLHHQADYQGTKKIREYSRGDNNSGPGTYSPIMGAGYYTQRTTWRLGDSPGDYNPQNDVQLILSNPQMAGFVETGVGHSRQTATVLPLNGSAVDPAAAAGIIAPSSAADPQPIGKANYTSDWWVFASDGVTPITLVCNDGTQFIAPGVADPGATLRSALSIYDAEGELIGTATEAADTLSRTYTATLPEGMYYAEVASFGGHTQTLSDGAGGFYNTTWYYDMGAYFLSGSGFAPLAVPEPAGLVVVVLVAVGAAWRRR